MKILVVSDNHGDAKALEEVYKANPKADLYLHCGDSCMDKSENPGFLVVEGNCDFDDFPFEYNLPTKWGTIHMEHGDRLLAQNKYYIENLNCFIYLFGHTHRKYAGKIGDTYVFNPGSLTRPRDGADGSYLIITIDDSTGELTYEFKSF